MTVWISIYLKYHDSDDNGIDGNNGINGNNGNRMEKKTKV